MGREDLDEPVTDVFVPFLPLGQEPARVEGEQPGIRWSVVRLSAGHLRLAQNG